MNKTLKILLIVFAIIFFIAENFYLFWMIGTLEINKVYYRDQMLTLCENTNLLVDIVNDNTDELEKCWDAPNEITRLETMSCTSLLID